MLFSYNVVCICDPLVFVSNQAITCFMDHLSKWLLNFQSFGQKSNRANIFYIYQALCGIIPQALKVLYHTFKCSVSQQKEFVNSINCISYLSLMTSKCLFVMLNQKLDVYTLSYMYSNTILTLLASGYINNK